MSGEHTLGEIAEIYGVAVDEDRPKLTLADYFDIHLDHAPKEGATLALDSIVLVARSISGGRVNVVGLRLPEEEEEPVPLDPYGVVPAQAVGNVGVGRRNLAAEAISEAGENHYRFDRQGAANNPHATAAGLRQRRDPLEPGTPSVPNAF